MASTTFSGPVRSEGGFQMATKNATTGAVTTRMSSGMPDLTGLVLAAIYPPIMRVIWFANTRQLGYLHHYLFVVI